MKSIKWTSSEIESQKGKVIIITGANSGLGLEAAKALSRKEATIIMAVRNIEKGKIASAEILKESPNASLELMHLDLSDLKSVKQFSDVFHSKFSRLDILMNNAGIMFPAKREVTKQGFEIQFGTNHLGHFALTGLLLDLIIASPDARVVTQSSMAHKMGGNIHFNDLNLERRYNKMKAYAQSKLANLLFTYELDRQFKAHKINAVAAASHPGISITNLFRTTDGIFGTLSELVAQNAEMGSLPILRAATEEGLAGAEYFGPTRLMEVRGYPELVRSNRRSYNVKLARDLWVVSENLTGISYNFGTGLSN